MSTWSMDGPETMKQNKISSNLNYEIKRLGQRLSTETNYKNVNNFLGLFFNQSIKNILILFSTKVVSLNGKSLTE